MLCENFIKKLILNKNKISFKNFVIKHVYEKEYVEFLTNNSFNSNNKCQTCYGLYVDDILLQTVAINDDTIYFCENLNFNMENDYSILLNHVKQNVCFEILIHYNDLDKNDGKYLEKLGFVYHSHHEFFFHTKGKRAFFESEIKGGEYKKIFPTGNSIYVLTK